MMYSPIRETCTDAVRVSHRTPLLLLSLALLAAGCEKPVTLHEPTEPLFVGSYAKIHVNIQASSGLTMDDLDFVVPAGPKGGLISLSRDTSFDPQNPVIMLLGGHELGTYHLQAIEKSTNDVLDEVEFTLTTKWPNDQAGPSLWVSGNFELPGSRGSTWGGGSTSEPDHYNVIPALGTTRLAVLLVDKANFVRAGVAKQAFGRIIELHAPPTINAAAVGFKHFLGFTRPSIANSDFVNVVVCLPTGSNYSGFNGGVCDCL